MAIPASPEVVSSMRPSKVDSSPVLFTSKVTGNGSWYQATGGTGSTRSSTSLVETPVRQLALRSTDSISLRLHCESCELPLKFADIRKVGGVDWQREPGSASCGAPKLCAIS